MAVAPTELLAEDVRRLEESNQKVAARMEGLEKEFASFRSRVNTILAITSAVAVVVLSSAGMIWTGVSALERELGRLEATVSNQTAALDRLDKRFDEVRAIGEKLNRVSEDLARLQGRLDRDGRLPARKDQ